MSEKETGIKNLRFIAEADLTTLFGRFRIRGYQYKDTDCVSLHIPDQPPKKNPVVRIQSSCLFGETFNSVDCDCRWQVHHSLSRISEAGAGIFIYLYQEGRGIGILDKIRAYEVQQEFDCDTVEAFEKMGLGAADFRNYDAATAILKHYNVNKCRLLTNNREKSQAFVDSGFAVTTHNLLPEDEDFKNISSKAGDFGTLFSYLDTKRKKLHQDIDSQLIDKLRRAVQKED